MKETSAKGLLSFIPAYRVEVPVVVVGCNNCGYLTMHAEAVLTSGEAEQ